VPPKQESSKKSVEKKSYTFAQIEKMADREIVFFENPIGGGSFHLFTESVSSDKHEQLNFDGAGMGETIPLNIHQQSFDDKSYSKKCKQSFLVQK